MSQHEPPLPGGVRADTIRVSTRVYVLAPSQASFSSPTAAADRLTDLGASLSHASRRQSVRGGRGTASNSYIRMDTVTQKCN